MYNVFKQHREIKVMRMHRQQMKIKKNYCFWKTPVVVASRFWNFTYQTQSHVGDLF